MSGPFNPPIRGETFVLRVSLANLVSPGSFKANPTIAAGDFKVDKDGAGLTNLTTLPVVQPAGSVLVVVSLSATEMDADVVTIVGIDQSSTKEWGDFVLSIPTAASTDTLVTNVEASSIIAGDVLDPAPGLIAGDIIYAQTGFETGGSVSANNTTAAVNMALGATLSASTRLILAAGTTAISSLRMLAGVAPSAPTNGDVWFTGTVLQMRVGGVTKTITMT